MPDGVILAGAGVLTLVIFTADLVRRDRAAGHSLAPDTRGWLLLAVGTVATVSGAVLLWVGLFSR